MALDDITRSIATKGTVTVTLKLDHSLPGTGPVDMQGK
jgi:hypothetical protein